MTGGIWGLVSFAHGKIAFSPTDTEARWQLGVDVIYRTLTCELIGVNVYMECDEPASLLSAIRSVSPFVDSAGSCGMI